MLSSKLHGDVHYNNEGCLLSIGVFFPSICASQGVVYCFPKSYLFMNFLNLTASILVLGWVSSIIIIIITSHDAYLASDVAPYDDHYRTPPQCTLLHIWSDLFWNEMICAAFIMICFNIKMSFKFNLLPNSDFVR